MPPANVYFTSLPLKLIQITILGAGLYFSLKIFRKGSAPAGAFGRGAMTLAAFAGFSFLFLLPMSGAC